MPTDAERVYQQAWKDANRQHVRDYANAYYANNKVKGKASRSAYYYSHKAKVLAKNKLWQRTPKRRAYGAAYLRKMRKEQPERFKVYESRRKDGRERHLINYRRNKSKYIDRANARRDKTSRIETPECTARIALLHKECFCHWCCRKLNDVIRTIDHVIPLFRGGQHIPDNLVAACRSCNSSKGKKLVSEWTWELYEEAA